MYRWVWERHARPHVGHLRVRDLTPLDVARFRADLEADGIGAESIRKTLTMLGSVFSRAVEWELVPANPIRAARKPPSSRSRTLPAIGPDLVEAMRARLRSSGRERDAVLLVLLAYQRFAPENRGTYQSERCRCLRVV